MQLEDGWKSWATRSRITGVTEAKAAASDVPSGRQFALEPDGARVDVLEPPSRHLGELARLHLFCTRSRFKSNARSLASRVFLRVAARMAVS